MFIVVYRPHNLFNCDTQYIGPFASWEEADDVLCSLPALGTYTNTPTSCNPGVKFTADLCSAAEAVSYTNQCMKGYGTT